MDDVGKVLFGTGPVVVAAKEAGAGALLAALMAARPQLPRIVALAQPPADRCFEDLGVALERAARTSGGSWNIDIERLLVELAPVRIVVGASAGATIEKALIEIGAQHAIPVISIVDHYWNLWQRFAGATPRDRWRYVPDVIYVPSQWCVARLAVLQCPVTDVRWFRHPFLLGTPTHRSLELRAPARESLGFTDDDTVILFVSEYVFADQEGWQWEQPADRDITKLGRELAALASELTTEGISTRLLIRPHPAEQHDWNAILATPAAPSRAPVVVDRSLDKAALLSAADMAVGLNSMLLAEAALSGIPTYCRFPLGTYGGPKLSDFQSDIVELKTLEDCRAAIRENGRASRAERGRG